MQKRFTQSLPLLGTLCLLIIGSAVLFKLTPAGAIIAITAEAETLPVDASETEVGIAESATPEASQNSNTEEVGTTNTITVPEPDRVKNQVVSKTETVQNDSFLQTNGLVILGALIAVSVVITMAIISVRQSPANR